MVKSTSVKKSHNVRLSVHKATGYWCKVHRGRRDFIESSHVPDASRDCGDIVAVRSIMGHTDAENDMSARYRQKVSDERLRRAVDTVHGWLYGGAK